MLWVIEIFCQNSNWSIVFSCSHKLPIEWKLQLLFSRFSPNWPANSKVLDTSAGTTELNYFLMNSISFRLFQQFTSWKHIFCFLFSSSISTKITWSVSCLRGKIGNCWPNQDAGEDIHANAQNFYLLKIHLNLFEISNRVLKFENWIKIWNFFIPFENLFPIWTLRSVCIQVYHVTWHHSAESMFEINFQTE